MRLRPQNLARNAQRSLKPLGRDVARRRTSLLEQMIDWTVLGSNLLYFCNGSKKSKRTDVVMVLSSRSKTRISSMYIIRRYGVWPNTVFSVACNGAWHGIQLEPPDPGEDSEMEPFDRWTKMRRRFKCILWLEDCHDLGGLFKGHLACCRSTWV